MRSQAVIMAGGKGARLYPYTALMPKPLMPIGDMPILELLLRQLKYHSVSDAILAVNHLQHLIRSFFGDGSAIGMKLHYNVEDRPLGTAGAIGNMLDRLSDHFIVSNGDLLTNLNFGAMMSAHIRSGAVATIATHVQTTQMDFGALTLDERGRVLGVEEKPILRFNAGIGMYVLSREAVAPYIREGLYLDMPTLVTSLIEDGKLVQAYQEECRWLDIGRPDDYGEAQAIFERDASVFLPPQN